MNRDERGQVTPIVAMVLVVAAVVGLAIVGVGSRAVDAAQARTAADASALAGAADGPAAARSVAAANHATLESFEQLGNDVVVTVVVRTASASARARATWPTGAIRPPTLVGRQRAPTLPAMAPDPHGTTAEVESPEDGAGSPTAVAAPVTEGVTPARMAAVYTPTPAATTAPAVATAPQGRNVRRGRRVKRVIRRIELWSVLKLSLVFYTCMYIVVMASLVVLWGFAYSTGLVDNFESFANDVGFEHWQFYGQHMFHQAAVIGGVLVVAATIVTVLATVLVNVISELTGGIRVVVIEEEVTFIPHDDEHASAGGTDSPSPGKGRSRRR